jgi:hypothetical protein
MSPHDARYTDDLPADPAAEDALLEEDEHADEFGVLLTDIADRLTAMPDELTIRRHLAAMRDAHTPSRARLGRRLGASAAATVAASAFVLASVGMLPPPVQRVASDTVARVGIDWPGGRSTSVPESPLMPESPSLPEVPPQLQGPPAAPEVPGPGAGVRRERPETPPVPRTSPAPATSSGPGSVAGPADRPGSTAPRAEVDAPASPPEGSVPQPQPTPPPIERAPEAYAPHPTPSEPRDRARPDEAPLGEATPPAAPATPAIPEPSPAPHSSADGPRPSPVPSARRP